MAKKKRNSESPEERAARKARSEAIRNLLRRRIEMIRAEFAAKGQPLPEFEPGSGSAGRLLEQRIELARAEFAAKGKPFLDYQT